MLRLESLQMTDRSLVKEQPQLQWRSQDIADARSWTFASDGEHGWPKREAYKLQMAELGRLGCSSS